MVLPLRRTHAMRDVVDADDAAAYILYIHSTYCAACYLLSAVLLLRLYIGYDSRFFALLGSAPQELNAVRPEAKLACWKLHARNPNRFFIPLLLSIHSIREWQSFQLFARFFR
jgi:hypothetical protein